MAWLGSCLIPFVLVIRLLCFELHKARQPECFRNELYSFVQRLIPRTLSFFGKIVALVNELSCYNVWVVKIQRQPRYELKCVWIAEFQSIVLRNKCVSEIINCLLLSCFWALMAYYLTIWYWRWCTFLWTS